MEEESDFRPYFEAMMQKWKWIVAGAVLAALVALGASSLQSPTYTATALVALALPRQVVEFDSRISATTNSQSLKAYPQLAMSDELLLSLLADVKLFAPEVENLSTLRGLLSASSDSDPSLISLSTSYEEPQIATNIANRWAELFVIEANEVFGTQGDEQLGYFRAQLASATLELQQAEEALIDFEARNRSTILGNELAAMRQTQADYLTKQRQLVFVLQDAERLQKQLENSNNGDVTTEDQLAAIVLQLRAVSDVPIAEQYSPNSPLQLHVNLDQISNASRQEQITYVSQLQDSLGTQVESINVLLAELEPQMLALQQEKQESVTEGARLGRNHNVTVETYTALARKVEEEQITSENTESGVRLASRSAVPEFPSGSSTLLNIIMAMAIGTILSISIIVAITWWKIYFDINLGNRTSNQDAPASHPNME